MGKPPTERQRQVLACLADGELSIRGLTNQMHAKFHVVYRARGGVVRMVRTLRRRGLVRVVGGGTAWCRPGHPGSTQMLTKEGREALTEISE